MLGTMAASVATSGVTVNIGVGGLTVFVGGSAVAVGTSDGSTATPESALLLSEPATIATITIIARITPPNTRNGR
jgi:hypothetical protein